MTEINDTKEIPEGTFPVNLKLIKQHQQTEPSLLSKYKDGTYHTGYFHGESNIYLNLIKCEDNIVIPSIIQRYILHWYHTYLPHPGMDRMEDIFASIFTGPE